MSNAGLLVTEPAELLTATVKTEPLSLKAAAGVVYVLAVAPGIGVPSRSHWYRSAGPVACTVKPPVSPIGTLRFAGCDTMDGDASPPEEDAGIVPEPHPTRLSRLRADVTLKRFDNVPFKLDCIYRADRRRTVHRHCNSREMSFSITAQNAPHC